MVRADMNCPPRKPNFLSEPQASPLTGILLGDDSGIPKSVQDAFRTTGASHLIAISGYNVMILPDWQVRVV